MLTPLDFLGDRSQALRERAARLLEKDESFQELCTEHEECARAVVRLEASGTELGQLRAEYVGLLLRLERELLRYLEEHPDPGRRP
jgi:hypothetical protein